ncbi:MAG: SpoIIE family protein phosphatase [Spirochaetes bacterium]|nr:SpoIIE family protein phosphatase [Spirochaetota bacterium]
MANKNKQKEKESIAQSDAGKRVKFSIRYKFALAILSLVSLIIVTMAVYIRNQTSNILKEEIMSFARRETENLLIIAQESLKSRDDLALITSLNSLKRVPSIEYAHIVDDKLIIRMALSEKENGEDVSKKEGVKEIIQTKEKNKIFERQFNDENTNKTIYEFYAHTFNPLNNAWGGFVRLGFSDKIIRDRVMQMTFVIAIIALAFLGIAVIGAILMSGVIIKPIRKLAEGVAIIGTGNLDYRIELPTSDELGVLANEFNTMTVQLKKSKEMEIEKKLQDEQIALAKEIQEGLNPMGFYNKRGVEIKGFTRAAKGVGGDYFDYIDINEHMVGALISDVSGKGIPASLVMVMIRTVFTTYIKGRSINCAAVVRAINDSLSADFAIDKFATLFFMIYDRRTAELSFSNAGHGPLRCFRSSKNAFTLTKLEGVPIGIMEDVEYKQAKIKLEVGDFIILNTDGITEMRNEKKEEYGYGRLQRLLLQNHQRNAKELVELIVNDVDEFRGDAPPHDDMTILVLKRTA